MCRIRIAMTNFLIVWNHDLALTMQLHTVGRNKYGRIGKNHELTFIDYSF